MSEAFQFSRSSAVRMQRPGTTYGCDGTDIPCSAAAARAVELFAEHKKIIVFVEKAGSTVVGRAIEVLSEYSEHQTLWLTIDSMKVSTHVLTS